MIKSGSVSKCKFWLIYNLQKFKLIFIYLQTLTDLTFNKTSKQMVVEFCQQKSKGDYNLQICNVFLLGGDISQCLVLVQIIQIEYWFVFWSLAISWFATTWELSLPLGHVNFIQIWIVPGIFDLALQGVISMKINLTMANSEVSACICINIYAG